MRKKLIIILLLISGLCLSIPKVYGNSAAPIIGDGGSGIFFDTNKDIRISKEVLNIKLNGYTAEIEAIYTLENTSSTPINNLTTFFISPVNDSYSNTFTRDFVIKQNDNLLDLEYYYYASDNYSKDDWEDIIIEDFSNKYSVVDTTANYYLYKINPTSDIVLNINNDNIIFDLNPDYMTSISDTLKFTKGTEYEFLSNKQFDDSDFTSAVTSCTEVNPNEYLYNFYCNHYKESDINEDYISTKANNSLYYLSKDFKKMIMNDEPTVINCSEYYNYYAYSSNIVQAVAYELNFEANQTSTVSVKYNYLLSHSFGYFRDSSSFLYYLSPAKYWQSFQDLTINLTLDDEYTELRDSSLKFTHIEGNTYQYKSNTLPDVELSFTVAKPLFSSGARVVFLVIIIVLALIGITVLVTAIMLVRLVVVGVKRKKDKVNKKA